MKIENGSQTELILGIETSCDDTGVAIIENGKILRANELLSQTDFHKIFDGVVPEIASRKHFECIHLILDNAFQKAKCRPEDLCGVGCTIGPGLSGSLLVGVCTAKAIAFALNIPFLPINHLLGHIHANFLSHPDLKPPFLVLLVSGGHTDIYELQALDKIIHLGGTLDDAAGEAFDKGARVLGLPYPGGPSIAKAAISGNPMAISLPKPLKNSGNFDFSFSGLKTSLLYFMKKNPGFSTADAAASYQEAITEVLIEKVFLAGRKTGSHTIVFAGGVSANQVLRNKAEDKAKKWGYRVLFPKPEDCTDNAAMIARAAWYYYKKGMIGQPNSCVDASLTIEKTMISTSIQST
jgi:N6-L-threonylcarbamoyladenine synthase